MKNSDNLIFTNTIKNFTWIIIILICSTCSNDQKITKSLQIIDIEKNMNQMEVIKLSQFTSNIRYMPLETDRNIYVPYIDNCYFLGDYIIVINLKQCLLYNTDGKFIQKFGSEGRGPGEYHFIESVGFDRDSNIYIQSLRDLLEFKIDGSFVKKTRNKFILNNNMNEFFINSIVIDDSLFFGHIPNLTGLIKNKAILINKEGEIIKLYKNYILFEREQPVGSGFEDYANVYQFDKSIYYKEFYNDTLFYLDSQYNLIPEYAFKFGKYKEPTSERAKLPGHGSSMSEYLYIWNVFQTDKYLLINCQFGDHFPAKRLNPKVVNLPGGRVVNVYINTNKALGIYNKKSNSISFCKPTSTDNRLFTSGIYNDIDAGPRFFPMQQVNDSTMVMWMKADEFIEHIKSDDFKNNMPKYPQKKKQLEELANNLSEFNSSVLMFVTFKCK